MKDLAVHHADTALQDLGGGTTRRILAHNESLMAVEVGFETGAVGAAHTPPHTQISYALSGRFRYTIGGVDSILEPGDSIVVASGLVHGTECLEAGVLLDVFTPRREDFLAKA